MFHVIRLKSLVLCLVIFVASVLVIRFSLKEESAESTRANASAEIIPAVFNASHKALSDAMSEDLKTKESEFHVSQADIITYLACIYENDFSLYSKDDITRFTREVRSGKAPKEIFCELAQYENYYSVYKPALGGFIGKKDGKYGLTAFCPIGIKNSYSHTNDFNNHSCVQDFPGNDIFTAEKSEIVAVEGGVISQCGFNNGVFSVTVSSDDGKRHYLYSNFDSSVFYANGLKEGVRINAGSILGHFTSETAKSDSKGKKPFHFGIKIIPEISDTSSDSEIWINPYDIILFLSSNQTI